jgi:hypothetical protein
MAKGKQRKFHVVDFVENMKEICSNFFDLIMSNIASNNSNVENIAIHNVAVDSMAIIEVV